MCTQSANGKSHYSLTISDIATIGVMVATLEAAKLVLNYIPNVELVTLLIILYSVTFGRKTLYAVFVFVLIEGLLYGFGVWWIMYLYIWPLISIVGFLLRKQSSVVVFATLSGIFGLAFGALCSIPYFFISGWKAGFTYFIAGIPFDLIHGISNFILCLLLWVPLRSVLNKLNQQRN